MKNIVIATCIAFTSLSAQAGDFLTGDQIKEAFSSRTITWEHMFKNKSGKSYVGDDGTIIGISNDDKREGKWHIDGDKWCVSWGKCLAIESDGNGGYYKVKGSSKRVVHITKIEDGNTF